MFKVAMVGWGMSAKTFHLPYVEANDALQLVAVVTSQQEACRSRYPDVVVYPNIDRLTSAGIDLAIVATPNHVHYSQAKQLLSRGIAVVVDKPATLTTDELADLFVTAHQHGVWLAVYHNRRWDGDFLGLQQALQRGDLGQPRVFLNQFDRFRPAPRDRWREHAIDGAGIWYDLGPHLVDQALCLFGRPDAVSASLRALREGSQNVDYAHVVLHYPDKEVVLRSSPFCCEPMLRFQLETDHGTWRKHGLDPQEDQLKAGLVPSGEQWRSKLPVQHASWVDASGIAQIDLPAGDYGAFYRAVALALAGEGVAALPVTAQQALDVATIIDVAQASDKRGERLVVPWRTL